LTEELAERRECPLSRGERVGVRGRTLDIETLPHPTVFAALRRSTSPRWGEVKRVFPRRNGGFG
jgi:hypothetical protein